MKIISKYKDYYDYLVGAKFGLDNKVILDRTSGFVFKDFELKPNSYSDYDIYRIAICGFLYDGVLYKEGKFYWGGKIEQLGKWRKNWNREDVFEICIDGRTHRKVNINPVKTNINDEEDCPIVFVSGVRNQNRSDFPCLKILGIASIYPPEKIYMDIYNWISKRNEFVYNDDRTDLQKLKSFGFDDKKSFRHRK